MLVVADESVDRRIIGYLRHRSLEVFSIFEESRGIDDNRVLGRRIRTWRSCYQSGLKHHGILLLRFGSLSIEEKMRALEDGLFNFIGELKDNFGVLDQKQLRIRKL